MRMWAGIHFRSDVVAGQKIGEGCGLAGHSVRGSTTRAVGVRLAFDWGLLGATRHGILVPECLAQSFPVSFIGKRWLSRTGRVGLSAEHVERRLTAILAADIAGYSRLMGNDEEG